MKKNHKLHHNKTYEQHVLMVLWNGFCIVYLYNFKQLEQGIKHVQFLKTIQPFQYNKIFISYLIMMNALMIEEFLRGSTNSTTYSLIAQYHYLAYNY
jgi:hypothetical protein